MNRKIINGNQQGRIVRDAQLEQEYAGSLSGIFDELVECSTVTGQCRGIFYTEGKCRLSLNRSIDDFSSFAWEHVHAEECRSFLAVFNRDFFNKVAEGRKMVRCEFRCRCPEGNYTWLKVLLIPEKEQKDIVLCYVADLGEADGEKHLLKQIVDRYVYRNCDYLICLDASTDTYTMFRRNEGASMVPAETTGSYSRMVKECIEQYVVSEDRERVAAEVETGRVLSVLDSEGEHIVTYGIMDPDRGYLRKRFQFVYYDKPDRIVLLLRCDITGEYREQLKQKERLEDALKNARVDSLTGLCNRQSIYREVSRYLEDPLCPRAILLFVDLDNFKHINDTMGHRSGDHALRLVSELFRSTLRTSDLVGRVGGDEFVAFLTGITSDKEGMECAKRLCDAVSQIEDPALGGLKLSCSIGGAVYPRDGRNYDALFVKADTAAYEAKRQGKNRYVFYTPGLEMKSGYCTSSM